MQWKKKSNKISFPRSSNPLTMKLLQLSLRRNEITTDIGSFLKRTIKQAALSIPVSFSFILFFFISQETDSNTCFPHFFRPVSLNMITLHKTIVVSSFFFVQISFIISMFMFLWKCRKKFSTHQRPIYLVQCPPVV